MLIFPVGDTGRVDVGWILPPTSLPGRPGQWSSGPPARGTWRMCALPPGSLGALSRVLTAARQVATASPPRNPERPADPRGP